MDRSNADIIELRCSPLSFGRASERDKLLMGGGRLNKYI